jgi:hypothetical protein
VVGEVGEGIGAQRKSGEKWLAKGKRKTPGDEGMPNGPSIFAYLVFGPGGTIAEGITRRIMLIAWRDPGAKLVVHGEGAKEEA